MNRHTPEASLVDQCRECGTIYLRKNAAKHECPDSKRD